MKKKPKKNKPLPKHKATKASNLKLKIAMLLAVFAALLYLNTLGHQYTLDDHSVIKSNYITQQGWKGIPTHLTNAYRHGYWNSTGTLYRPLSLVMFAAEWGIAADSPRLYHFVNILLYAMCGFLLFYVLANWFKKYNIVFPFIASLLFIAHPIHTEEIANIKGRDELLVLFFALGSFWLLWKYINAKNKSYLVAAVLSYGLAMFSKESAITLLAIFPLALYFFSELEWKRIVVISSWFVLPVIIFLLIRQSVLGSFYGANISPLDNLLKAAPDASSRFATAFLLLGQYLKTLFIPHPLVHELGYQQIEISSWANWKVLLSLFTYLGMGIFALINIKKKSPIAFGILFFLITFSIATNLLVLIGTSYAERLLFLPSLGFSIVVAYVILLLTKSELFKKKKDTTFITKYKRALGITLLLVVVYSFKTITRNTAWENSYTLYQTDIEYAPQSAKLQYHYGLELVKQAKATTDGNEINQFMTKAVNAFNQSIQIYPNYGDAYAELGITAYRAKDYAKALEFYKKSLSIKPNNPEAYSNMGVVFSEQGQRDKAIEQYKKAIELNPRYVDALRNLGVMYTQNKQFTEAIKYFLQALQYEPNDPTLNNYLGMSYRDSGDPTTAEKYFRKAK